MTSNKKLIDLLEYVKHAFCIGEEVDMLIQIKEIVEKHGSRVEFGFGRIGIGVAGEKGKPTNELMIWNLKTEQPIGSEVKNTKGKTSDDVNTISRWRFNNLESLQVVIDALNDIKADVFGEQQPQPDEELVEGILDSMDRACYTEDGYCRDTVEAEIRTLLQSRQIVVTREEIHKFLSRQVNGSDRVTMLVVRFLKSKGVKVEEK